ncbi:methyl-accepting chemotaxis protein [Domibacillus sp. DTU_2020_1001157_1_SI_ALB_TIR_016]|uniref:methyl-accepting chemotaxis protein n=1 Tax=Domibacillus sp. DTU_2020_1001157_1_SI_ALB_TIR_016 TaxID=3077789 RepID=UPI0028ED4FB6|nr:methyl-accepting chemotaxis protein [Domibacillus sp. DTU_2020_1001157_1_SI_ALB_TIR_016]WNS80295.1 methyl-accepting chemotaxis protein [Domibacillus sp. DTU_2020_1001157_1_SI_ALB_TIR_016]
MKLSIIRPKKSLKSQLTLGFLVPFVAFSLVICLFFINLLNTILDDHVLSQFNHRLEENGTALARTLSSQEIEDAIQRPEKSGSLLKSALDDFIKEREGIEYVYVLTSQDNKDYIVALNGSDEYMKESPFTPEQEKAFTEEHAVVSSIYTDQWGVHKSFFIPIEGTDTIVGVDMDASFIHSLEQKALFYPLLFLVLSVLLGTGSAIWLGSRISSPIKRLAGFTQEIADGNLRNPIRLDREDEIGMLAGSFESMRRQLNAVIQNVHEKAEDLSQSGNTLFASFQELTEASDQIASSTQTEAMGAEDRSRHLESLSNLMLDMTEAVEQMNKETGQIKEMATETSHLSQSGSQQVETISSQIQSIKQNGLVSQENLSDLNSKLTRISEIVELIRNVSAQTNLLSLNAAIEAARAGEAGKGFAVVAQEIQKLAQQTAASAQDITATVEEINKQTNKVLTLNETNVEDMMKGVDMIEDSGKLFSKIFQAVEELETRSERIFTNSRLVSNASEEALTAIQEISAISEQGTAITQEIAASAQQQNQVVETAQQQSGKLREVAYILQEMVSRFETLQETDSERPTRTGVKQ